MRDDVSISIHALREEGDTAADAAKSKADAFLSTPSARRATTDMSERTRDTTDFYPRPPRGGRLIGYVDENNVYRFLSTPSARRATLQRTGGAVPHRGISIHALREEGDKCRAASALQCNISIHALREEGDGKPPTIISTDDAFLSTPSARRATAKTERKPSAFVSLYTSLHKLQRGACKTNRKITPLLAQTAGIPVRSVRENHVRCLFALAGHQKISTLSCANSGCSPTCSTLVW